MTTAKFKTKSTGSGSKAPQGEPKTKMQLAADKAIATGKMANTLAKALGRRVKNRWKFLDFTTDGKKRESAGIVDIIAIRKCGKPAEVKGLKVLDLFDLILIQVKGGSAPRPTAEDIARLKAVAAYYRARDIALFEWVKGKKTGYFVLDEVGQWVKTAESKLFGK